MSTSKLSLSHSADLAGSGDALHPLDSSERRSTADQTEPPSLTVTIDASAPGTEFVSPSDSSAELASQVPAVPPRWRFSYLSQRGERRGLPRYRLPLSVVSNAILSSFRNQRRPLRADVARMVASMPVEPLVHGIENLPAQPPFVILPNHYERPSGAWVGWGAIVITDALARARPGTFPIRWVMTSTWQDCYLGPRRVDPRYLHWVLRRLANLYGIILMPANDTDAFGRGAALRELFRATGDSAGQVVAFHPEAGGFETMIRPPKGMGRVLSSLDHRGVTLIPTGVYEAENRLQVRFGEPIQRGSLGGLADYAAAESVMLHIARLVPEQVRGEFRTQTMGSQI